jgi:hypothetical protein
MGMCPPQCLWCDPCKKYEKDPMTVYLIYTSDRLILNSLQRD